MSAGDIRKLLGGYATGTLSAEEQQALFEAALHDEKLFAALADEHALREMLDDPGNRAAVLRALEPKSQGWGLRWIVPVGIAAGLVVITSVIFVFQRPAPRGTFEMAKVAPDVVPDVVPNVVQPALQPEVQLETRKAQQASPAVRRQIMDREPAVASRRDVREEAKTVVLRSPGMAGAPAAALSAPVAAAVAEAGMRSAKMESVKVQAAPAVVTSSGSAERLVTVQGAPGLMNGAGILQYTILKRGADGQFKPVDAGSTFQAADAVRLNVETEEAGFLSVSQKEPPKMLFQGAVQKQVPVTIPATGSLDLSVRGALRIMFSQQAVAGGGGGMQNALLPGTSLSKRKATADASSEKSVTVRNAPDQAGLKDQAPGGITVDVNLNVATPAQQRK